jgi:hypothetical protein
MEEMMEALIQKNGISITPRTSVRASTSPFNDYQSDGDAYVTALVPVEPQFGFPQESPGSNPRRAIFERAERMGTILSTIHLTDDNRPYPFWRPEDYNHTLDRYFKDINPDVPCIHVAPFRLLSQQMLSQSPIDSSNIPFLALHYIMFACVEILANPSTIYDHLQYAWDWFQLADDLVGTKWLNEHGDMRFVQFFLLKARLPRTYTSIQSTNTCMLRDTHSS